MCTHWAEPSSRVIWPLTRTSVSRLSRAFTVISTEAEEVVPSLRLSTEVAVMVAVPGATPVTMPFLSTVATVSSLELQTTPPVKDTGLTFTESCSRSVA